MFVRGRCAWGMIDTQAICRRWNDVGSKLDKRRRRLLAAGEVRAAGRGGLEAVAKISGIARSTLGRGLKQVDAAPFPPGRVRQPGGGRRSLASQDATLKTRRFARICGALWNRRRSAIRCVRCCVALLMRFAGHDNLSIEQPLPYADIAGAAFVRAHAGVPVILDESIWSPEALMNVVRAEACDRMVLKLNRLGGFYPAAQAIAICEAAGIGVSVDTNPYTIVGDTAVCHIAAVARTPYPVDCEGHVSFLDIGDPNPFRGGVSIKGAHAKLPDAPGLGVDVDWGVVAAHQKAHAS